MPEIQFGVILFSMAAATAFAGVVLWSLKKAGAARRKKLNPPSGLLVGSVVYVIAYSLNRLAFPALPSATVLADLALLSGLLIFPVLKKKLRRPRLKHFNKNHSLLVEAAAMERMLKIDPLNAFCYERLSEIYENMGKPDRALAAAKEAVKLDPAVGNKSRVEELKRHMSGHKGGRGTRFTI